MRIRADLVPLSDRLAALQGARAVIAAAVVGVVTLLPAAVDRRGALLVPLCVVWVLATAGLEALRRLLRHRALLLMSVLLLADGIVLAVVVAETGGVRSPLLFALHLHVVACTLLASPRSGLSTAGWHGLLLITAQHLTWWSAPTTRSGSALTVAATSLLLVGAASAAFASLNERALRRSRRAANALVALGLDLERCRTPDDVALAAAAHCRDRLGGRRAAVLVHGSAGCSGARTDGSVTVLVAVRSSLGTSSIGGDPRLVTMLTSPGDWLLASVLPDASNLVVVPLVVDGAAVGVTAVEYGPDCRTLRSEDLELIEQSVARIALSLRTVQLMAEVESLATSDPLTGLPNRRLFDDTLAREVARSRRAGSALAVAMLDVDHFKSVNDRHGHQVGDEVLRELARALEKAARRESVVARYGGEEFVVLLPDATAAEAVIAAERLRSAAAEVRAVPVTISVGVAAAVGTVGPDDLVAAADAALYEAKVQGRDRVVLHRGTSASVGHDSPQDVPAPI